jgi:hypothetical protein
MGQVSSPDNFLHVHFLQVSFFTESASPPPPGPPTHWQFFTLEFFYTICFFSLTLDIFTRGPLQIFCTECKHLLQGSIRKFYCETFRRFYTSIFTQYSSFPHPGWLSHVLHKHFVQCADNLSGSLHVIFTCKTLGGGGEVGLSQYRKRWRGGDIRKTQWAW